MVSCLLTMNRLELFTLEFYSPRSCSDRASRRPAPLPPFVYPFPVLLWRERILSGPCRGLLSVLQHCPSRGAADALACMSSISLIPRCQVPSLCCTHHGCALLKSEYTRAWDENERRRGGSHSGQERDYPTHLDGMSFCATQSYI